MFTLLRLAKDLMSSTSVGINEIELSLTLSEFDDDFDLSNFDSITVKLRGENHLNQLQNVSFVISFFFVYPSLFKIVVTSFLLPPNSVTNILRTSI